jgi:hypothetical protein
MEEWRDVKNSPRYEVSNLGNVRHKSRKNILKPRKDEKNYGYICYEVHLADETGKQRNQKIHRLVAEAFIPNPENKPKVDHIDRNPANNRADNLRWTTSSENNINAGLRSDNTSGHRGIFFCNQKQKWAIAYEFEKKKYHGGYYATLEEAVANYKDPSNLKSGETLDYSKPIDNSTGHKNISVKRNGFVFEITQNKVRHRKNFKTLEEAVAYKTNYLGVGAVVAE